MMWSGGLAGGADDLLVALVADEEDVEVVLREADGLLVDLGDERAGRVDRGELPLGRLLVHGRGDAVRGEHDDRASGGTSAVSSTKIAPFFSRVCTTYLLWTISWRT